MLTITARPSPIPQDAKIPKTLKRGARATRGMNLRRLKTSPWVNANPALRPAINVR